jgi:hypothetical protein
MSLTKAHNRMIAGSVVNVLDFGADPTGVIDSTSAIAAAIAAGQRIEFPPGVYKCNILLENASGKYLVGQTQGHNQGTSNIDGVRLFPADNTKPVIDVGSNGYALSVVIENFCLDSEITGSQANYTRIGIGLRVKANTPNFVWKSAFRKLFIRGFEDGLFIDCDINFSEVFDNDFQDIECIGVSRFSFKTRGVYNRFGKLFATQCGIEGGAQPSPDYAIRHDGSHCFFDSMVSDGRQYWAGTGNFVAVAVIEAIKGPGVGLPGFPAMELTGTGYNTWQNIRLNGVPDSKFKVGVRIFGALQTVGHVIIEGIVYPSTGFLFAGGGGVLTHAVQPPGAAKAAQPQDWSFLGDVSAAINAGPIPLPWLFQTGWDGTEFIIPNGTSNVVLNPNTNPLTAGTVIMQQAGLPPDGQKVTISTAIDITNVTFKTTGIYSFWSGATITQSFPAGSSRSFIFRLADLKWYPI